MFKTVSRVIANIKGHTRHVLTPQWKFFLFIYQALLFLVCIYHETKIHNAFSFTYVVTYLIWITAFHLLYIIYSILRSNQFVDIDLFWITTLGAIIYWVI